jgi:hypothetical protein
MCSDAAQKISGLVLKARFVKAVILSLADGEGFAIRAFNLPKMLCARFIRCVAEQLQLKLFA